MKKFLITLALIVPVLAFTACGGDDDEPNSNNELEGTVWIYTEDEPEIDYYLTETLSFKSGSKCVYSVVEREDGETITDISVNATYKYNPPTVTLKMKYQGESATGRLTVSGDRMVDEDGYVFIRKK